MTLERKNNARLASLSRKPWFASCCWLRTLFLAGLVVLLAGCVGNMGKDARFGMYGGKPREVKSEPPFDVQSTRWDTRWFPAHVRWAPDDSHLLVSLCHVNRSGYCRIGKYWIAEKRWELLDLQPRITYRWPNYSPDGQHIVATVGACNENYVCPIRKYALVLLSTDAKRMTKLAGTIAFHPSFSGDGKKIIYWKHSGGGGAEVAIFDLLAGKEQMLTQLSFWDSAVTGAAFFLPGDERFVFSAWLGDAVAIPSGELLKKDGQVVYKDGRAVRDHPLRGTKLDLAGPNRRISTHIADMKQGIITKDNVTRIDLVWVHPLDVSRRGEALYLSRCIGECLKAKQAEGKYQADPGSIRLTSYRDILKLRPASENAKDAGFDTGEFWLPDGGQVAAVSNDSRQVAYLENAEGFWHFKNRFGIVSLDAASPIFIDWPRMEVDPAATQILSQ